MSPRLDTSARSEWERAYKVAWKTYYTMEHLETVLRRLAAKRGKAARPAHELYHAHVAKAG